jgi:hypothetical protein
MEIDYGNVFSGQKEDRVDDINLEVMRNMDDVTLSNFCKTSPYYKNLCENTIWLERIKAVPGLSLLLPYRSHYKSSGDFYLNVRNDAQYVVNITAPDAYGKNIRTHITNNIQETYIYDRRRLVEDKLRNHGHALPEDVPEKEYEIWLSWLRKEFSFTFTIMIRFDNVVDYDRLDDYTIYSITEGAPGYLNPNILSYPLLNRRDVYVAVERQAKIPSLRFEESFPDIQSFIKYNTESLRQVHKMGKSIILYVRVADISRFANHEVRLGWMRYGFDFIIRNKYQNLGLFLVDFDMLGLLPSGYHLVRNDGPDGKDWYIGDIHGVVRAGKIILPNQIPVVYT